MLPPKNQLARSFPPIADVSARALILGSMPGAASLEAGQYYAHPRNAFWPIMGELFSAGPTLPYTTRCGKLVQQGFAVWDVLRECRRAGSLDANIDQSTELPNDFCVFFARCPRIRRIYFNGRKAESAFRRLVMPQIDEALAATLQLAGLPSTSPAHAGKSLTEKLSAWSKIKDDLESDRDALCASTVRPECYPNRGD